MRAMVIAMVVLAAITPPRPGRAQVYRNETRIPAVTAANAPWQLSGEQIFHAGGFYSPSGPTEFFDAKVMVRVGVYEGIPLYEDATREPYSVVFVPVGGTLMRPYVRFRDDGFVGAIGTSGFSSPRITGLEPRAESNSDYMLGRVPASALTGTAASSSPSPVPDFTPVGVVSVGIPPATVNANPSGLWIEFGGARWYSAGLAVNYDSGRFEPAGDFRGFPVYRERGASGDRLFVTVVHDGPVAPFERR